MHGPYHRLAAAQDLTDVLEGEHTLINPMQVDDVGFLKLTEGGDIRSRVGDIHLEKMLPGEMQTAKDNKSLPKEMPSE